MQSAEAAQLWLEAQQVSCRADSLGKRTQL